MIEQSEWIIILFLVFISFTGGQLWSLLRDRTLLDFIADGARIGAQTVELVGDMLKELKEKFG